MCTLCDIGYVRLQLSRVNQKGINDVMRIIIQTVHDRI